MTIACGVAILVALASWPIASIQPQAGLDPSWMAGLHMAADRGLDFGRDIVFSYGPFGFLAVPKLFVGWTTALGLLFVLITQAAFAMLLVRALRPWLGLIGGALTAFAILAMLPTPTGVGDRSLLIPAFAALLVVQLGSRVPRPAFVAAGLGATLAFWLLVKYSVLALAPLGVLAVWRMAGARPWRLIGVFVGSFLGALMLLWIATGAALSALPGWLRDSMSIARGFDGALSVTVPQKQWEVLPALAICILVLAAAWRRDRGTTAARWAGLVGTGIILWMLLKQGFVRHDEHSYVFFAGTTLLALILLRPGRGEVLSAFAALFAFATCIAAFGLDGQSLLRGDTHVRQAVGQFADTIAPARRHQIQREARSAMAAQMVLSPKALRIIGRSTVHVMPYETSVIWTYRLNWRPTPVFQEYASYTPGLSRRNVEFLTSQDAPEFIITHPAYNASVFSSWPLGGDLAVDCSYRTVIASDALRVLRRSKSGCDAGQPIATVFADPGEPVPVPTRIGTDDMIVARFFPTQPGVFARIRGVLFRNPDNPPWVEFDGREAARLVPATAGEPHVLAPAADPSAASTFFPMFIPHALVIRGTQGSTRIEFIRVRLAVARE